MAYKIPDVRVTMRTHGIKLFDLGEVTEVSQVIGKAINSMVEMTGIFVQPDEINKVSVNIDFDTATVELSVITAEVRKDSDEYDELGAVPAQEDSPVEEGEQSCVHTQP